MQQWHTADPYITTFRCILLLLVKTKRIERKGYGKYEPFTRFAGVQKKWVSVSFKYVCTTSFPARDTLFALSAAYRDVGSTGLLDTRRDLPPTANSPTDWRYQYPKTSGCRAGHPCNPPVAPVVHLLSCFFSMPSFHHRSRWEFRG